MFATSDNISEIIAHFIGFFDVRVDEMRMRHSYDEFFHDRILPPDPADLPFLAPPFLQHLELEGFWPGATYYPLGDEIPTLATSPALHIRPSNVGVPHLTVAGPNGADLAPFLGGGAHQPHSPLGSQPGSTILVASQIIQLLDHDLIVLGDVQVGHPQFLDEVAALHDLVAAAATVAGPFADIPGPMSVAAISDYFDAMAQAFVEAKHGIAGDGDLDGGATPSTTTTFENGLIYTVSTLVSPSIEGLFVDGAPAATAPILEEALPWQLRHGAEAPTPEPQTGSNLNMVAGDMAISMNIESGANMLSNNVSLVAAGLNTTFLAVLGDYHSINAIIQTNVYSDNDRVDSRLPGAAGNTLPTTAVNIAEFHQDTRDAAATKAEADPGVFPTSWQVSVVQGDMVFVDWITQYSFFSDSDTHVLSAMGTTTTITSGENVGLNGVSFRDIGHYYDVIIIGGSFYDGNFIIQTNVLYDDDTLTMLSLQAGAHGSVSTGSNLLWNSASILNVGTSHWQLGIPDPYNDAIAAIGTSNPDMPTSFASDAGFEGFHAPKVLYVQGDLYDVHSIQQVNVMGDADLVATYESQVAGQQTDWTISTGSNALINTASIIDYDSVGTTAHVGGQIYSDAILIQAEIVNATGTVAQGDDALVNEVIAFLDIDLNASIPADSNHDMHVVSDGPAADIMQSVLA